MKGIIFNITQHFITETYGEVRYDEIISSCSLLTHEPFVGPGTYPGEDLIAIVVQASEKLRMPIPVFPKNLGCFMFLELARKYPVFVPPYKHPKDFLKTLETIIHAEVRKLYQNTYLPAFAFSETAAGKLVITYHSKRKLYPLMEGLIEDVGQYFKTPIKRAQRIFEKDGRNIAIMN